MAIQIPSVQELIDAFVSTVESKINQTVPSTQLAFARVLGRALAFADVGLYKYATGRILQALAITATGEGLDVIGANYGIFRIPAVTGIAEATMAIDVGVTLPINALFVNQDTGITYYPQESYAGTGGTQDIYLVCTQAGTIGNVEGAEFYTLVSPLAGMDSGADHNSMTTLGVDREEDEAYRRRILDEIRTVGGGGNGVDYRRWGEEDGNVARIFPYSGKPVDGSLGTSYPGDRTIYVEAVSTYGSGDGTADAALLDDVRDLINTDPDTGFERVPLGMTDSTLFVLSITKVDIFVTISSIVTPTTPLVDLQTEIEAALTSYLAELAPFVQGVDVDVDKNDTITAVSLSKVVQQILDDNGATAESIIFELTLGGGAEGLYTLAQGELAQLDTVTYV